MAQPPDPYTPHRPVPAKPIISAYPTPNFDDRVYKVHKDTRATGYRLPEAGAIFTGIDAEKYKDFVFCVAIPSDQTGWVDWIYVNDRLNQDAYNYTVEYPWEDEAWPRITRTYVTFRDKYVAPSADETDSAYPDCVLVDQKETRLEDVALNVLFVGVTKVFERIPAETEVALDRADSVLPFNMRVAVPGYQVTTIEQGAVGTGDVPEIVNEEDWNITDTTRTVFSRTRRRTKRVIPNGSITLNKGERLTREQQLGLRTETWAIGPQTIVPRATTIEASVDDIGNNTTVKSETEVERVFPEPDFKVEIPDLIPAEFRVLVPTTTEAITSEGQAAPPTLGPGELERESRQVTDLIKRDTVVRRDVSQLPQTLVDYELDEIQTHGSGFGGIFETDRTLDDSPQEVEEGFEITRSSVKNLGNGVTLKEVHKLSGVQGAHLQLTNPGSGFTCDPAVVFTSGTIGSDAEATAILSATPGGGGIQPGEDAGGVFNLIPGSLGDTNGLFYFLGARYNSGVWENPFTAGDVVLQATSDPNFPVSQDSLAKLVNRTQDDMNVTPVFNSGSHAIQVNLPPGATLKATHLSIQLPSAPTQNANIQKVVRVEGSNDGGTWATLGSDITLSFVGNRWVLGNLTNPNAFRIFRIFGTNFTPVNPGSNPEVYNTLRLSEIEFYGELTIVPGSHHTYQFNGDANGVFYYLGQRGGNGVWRNPSANGDIVVTADGPLVGTVDQIVDRLPSNVYTDGNTARAYYFDLKADRSLICNKLSFRQRTTYASGTTSFVLQGRNDVGDPLDWTSLVTVYPSQNPDAWTSVDVPGGVGYRQFRVISAQAFFTIGELELYGSMSLGTPPADTFSVTSVEITDGGHDYPSTGVEVRFVGGGGGTGAAGTAVITNGVVTRVDITNAGSGYATAPDVRFFMAGGGKDAAATGSISGGGVVSYIVGNGGSEYGVAPLVQVVGDGTGATAVAIVNSLGQVTGVNSVAIGTGYTNASAVFINAGGPTAIADVGYGVASVGSITGGSNYVSPPGVDIVGDGSGVQARAILGFPIGSVNINNRGSGYTSTPTVTAGGGGSGAALTAVRGFPVASVSFSPSGTVYLTPPAVVVAGGGIYGAGAQFATRVLRPLLAIQVGIQGTNYSPDTAVVITGDGIDGDAHVNFSFALNSITGGTGGTGYTVATVAIDAPTGINGVQATAHATLSAGAITAIVIDNPGFGYLTAPNVVISGDGTGASAATAVLETNGAINDVEIDDVGSGYSIAPVITLTGSSGDDAILTAFLDTSVSGSLSSIIDIINAGTGYTSAPTLSISGSPSPTPTLGTTGIIVAITVATAGSGYTQASAVGFSGGGGTGANATTVLGTISPTTGQGLGTVKSVVIDSIGEGFTTTPIAVFTGGHGTGASTNASGTPVLTSTGKIKTLTLIDPGPDYSVAPIVSFAGCSGSGATALYILASGFPTLTDVLVDPVEGIVVNVVKKLVRPDAVRPAGYVDVYALNKYRSIQITSSIDLGSLPPTENFFMTHVLNMPGTLLGVSATYNRNTKIGVGIDTAFGSTSVKASVDGKVFARILDGYKGPAKASVFRKFIMGAPTAAQTPSPLIISPTTGTVYLITNGTSHDTSLGVRGGFGYIEDSINTDSNVTALDISGVLTGGLIANSSSGILRADPTDNITAAIERARTAGFFFDGSRTRIAANIAEAQASLIVDIPASCPRSIIPGTTFLLSAVVEKWRFGLYVQTLTYVTIPCPAGTNIYGACTTCNGGSSGGET